MKKSNKKIKGEDIQDIDNKLQHYLGLQKEHFDHQFGLMYELLQINTESLEIVKTDIELIKHDLHKKVSYDEFIALENRVRKLENAKSKK